MGYMHRQALPLLGSLMPLFLFACSSGPPSLSMPPDKPQSEPEISLLSGMHTVILKTSKGDITLELDADAAPKTVTNFVTLAKRGTYELLTFHRVIDDFMIQGGDPLGTGAGGESIYGSDFEDEINAESYGLHEKTLAEVTDEPLSEDLRKMTIKQYYETQGYRYNSALESLPMTKGAIAMANRGPNTNGSQFFIIQAKATPWLEGKHTVFGKVVGGIEVVDAIAKVPTGAGGKPLEPVTFTVEVQE